MSEPTWPALSSELITRVEACCVAFWAEKLAVLHELEGNPYGVQLRRFGDAIALQATGIKNVDFNRVGNLNEAGREHLVSIIAWYRGQQVRCLY